MLPVNAAMGFCPTCCKKVARISLNVGERVGKTTKDEVPDKMFHLRTYWSLSGCPVSTAVCRLAH